MINVKTDANNNITYNVYINNDKVSQTFTNQYLIGKLNYYHMYVGRNDSDWDNYLCFGEGDYTSLFACFEELSQREIEEYRKMIYENILDVYGHSFLNKLNQELFTMALKLNEAYIIKNRREIIENLKLFSPLNTEQEDNDDEKKEK